MNHSRNIVLGGLALVAAVAVQMLVPDRPQRQAPVLEAPVPMLESTPSTAADAGPFLRKAVFGKLPPPAQNQITDPKKCVAPGEWIKNACWMPVAKQKPPCDPGEGEARKMWPHDDLCWIPMAEAKPVPTTGGTHTPGVADP